MPIAVLILELEDPKDLKPFRIVKVNEASENATGVKVNDITGKTMFDMFPDIYQLYPALLDAYFKGANGEAVNLGEIEYGDEHVDKSIFQVNVHPLKKNFLMVTYQNMTKLRATENKLKKANQNLESTVKKRTIQLEKLNAELEDFSFVAAHDLKSPISNLEAILSLIQRRGDYGEQTKNLINKFQTVTSLIKEKVQGLNQVMSISKTDDLKIKISIEGALEKVKSEISEEINNSNTELIVDFKECPTIEFIPSLFIVFYTT